ncbi:MAG: hypothetical protein M0R51_14800 [Clostridia bacterium]|jgi:hypothetical protein|nr:hypothetical protein [Clostridia bacterium]
MKKILKVVAILSCLLLFSCGNGLSDPYYNDAYRDQTYFTCMYTFFKDGIILYSDSRTDFYISFKYAKKWDKVYYGVREPNVYLGYFINNRTFKEEINQKLTYKLDD